MKKFLIASHGNMATGMLSSINILLGFVDHVVAIDCYIDSENVSKKFADFFKTVSDEDQLIMMSDLMGGSVNTQLTQYLNRPNTVLIAGVNLACALELIADPSETLSQEKIDEVVKQSQQMMQIVSLPIQVNEDFF